MQRFIRILCAGVALAVINPAHAAETKTVAQVYQEKSALAGQQVSVHGKVVKVNNHIMNKNFLHLQDGTGTEDSNDLTVTSDQTAEVGDEITITGTLVVDKDFGAGYTYPVILEQASISKK
jgi:predicted acyltransferase (DUF342 family)